MTTEKEEYGDDTTAFCNLLEQVKKPTMLLNEARVRANIRRMTEKARRNKVVLRPHFKTHQCKEVGQMFRDEGVDAIAVSSVAMGAFFAAHGFKDIMIAFPANIREMSDICDLAKTTGELSIAVESVETVRRLRNALPQGIELGLWVKVDTGYHRTGLDVDNAEEKLLITEVVKEILLGREDGKWNGVYMKGLMAHPGHTYGETTRQRIMEIYAKCESDLLHLREHLRSSLTLEGSGSVINSDASGISSTQSSRASTFLISVGCTPSCSILEDFSSIDEMRPGNFVFFDVMQMHIGSCSERDIAVGVLCPVVAKHPSRRTVVLYGGCVHLSSEHIVAIPVHSTTQDNSGTQQTGNEVKIFGYIAHVCKKTGWTSMIPGAYVSKVSQEHGIVTFAEDAVVELDRIEVGELLVVLPVHSCITCNTLRRYYTLAGKTFDIPDLIF